VSRGQRLWLWVVSVAFGAYIPLTIDDAGITRSASGPLLYLLWSVGVFCATFLVTLAIVTSQPNERAASPSRPLWLSTMRYAALPFAIFCVYLVAYFPAMMEADSYDQWHQIERGRFDAFFPIANSLVFWLPTLVWHSPAATMLVQMVLLAASFGFAMAVLEHSGVATQATWVMTALFAMHPVNGYFSVTFLKDTLFAAAILWLTVVVFRIVQSAGDELASKTTLIHLTLALAFVALLRPNGPVPAFGTAALLLVAFRKDWRPLAASFAAFVVIFFGTNVGLARAAHMTYVNHGFYSASPFIYDLGAVLHSDLVPDPKNPKAKPVLPRDGLPIDPRVVGRKNKFTREERGVLRQFDDLNEWARLYTPRLILYWHTEKSHWELLDNPEKKAELIDVWSSVARRYPGLILEHKLNAARIGWQIDADDLDPVMETSGPKEKYLGMRVPQFTPRLTEVANDLLEAIQFDRTWRLVTTMPAIWTYSCILFTAAFAMKRRSVRALLVGLPLLLNWVATMAACMAQNTRYFYAAYLVLPFVALLPWTLRRLGPRPSAT
jgi:hypothetical protein